MESNPDDKKHRELEERLKSAFPERWKQFSDDEKKELIETFFRLVWVDRIPPQETLKIVRNKGLSFGIVFVGALLAVVIGLLVNIIHGFFFDPSSIVIYFYVGAVILALAFLVWKLNDLFEESIDEEYRDSRFLDELVMESKVRNEIK